jgi:vacuolar-type H+-ATPase subunit I/STV1
LKLDNLSQSCNSSFSKLYENINTTLSSIRLLLTKYSENIEVVDPQLKNNSELVEAITDFENIWTKGKLYLLDDQKFKCFIVLSQYIERLIDTYPDFKSQVE